MGKKNRQLERGWRICIIKCVCVGAELLWNEAMHGSGRRTRTSTFSLIPKGRKGHTMPHHDEEPHGSMFQCIAAASSVALASHINPTLAWVTYVGVLIYAAIADSRRNRR